MVLTTRYDSNLKATVWNGCENFISIKFHVLKKASVPSSGIRRYFAKQKEVNLFFLVAESKILQSYYCQQPY